MSKIDALKKQIACLEAMNARQKQELLRLGETKKILNLVFNMVAGNHWWKDKEGVYRDCNSTMLKDLGLKSKADIVGKTDNELPWHANAKNLVSNDQEVMRTGQIQTGKEELVTDRHGVVRTFIVSKAPLRDKDGNIDGTVGCSIDITEQKKLAQQLEIAKEKAEAGNHAKTEFIANMSHDIRTPLTGIIGMSHQLEDEVDKPEEKQHAQWVHESGEQLLDLLNGVLDVVSSDAANENDVKHETFDLHHVVQDVLELERAAVKARRLDIKTHIDGAVPHYVVSDRMKVHRILLNLVGNAIKFTKVGHVEIALRLSSMRKEEALIEFQVIDTGIGIPIDLQDKVFDRFFKVSPSYKGVYTGNGIGLHIAQTYVELLGGKITLTSQVDVGTTFSFVLPMKIGKKSDCLPSRRQARQILEKEVTPPAVQPEVEPTQVNANASMQVLLVEDNFLALQVLKTMVEGLPAQVFTAEDAESALPLVKQQHFDLMITDIGLPGQSGDALTASIRAWEKENHKKPMPIVGLTGHAVGDISQSCLDAGMDQVYAKPMALDVLKSIVKAFVKRPLK